MKSAGSVVAVTGTPPAAVPSTATMPPTISPWASSAEASTTDSTPGTAVVLPPMVIVVAPTHGYASMPGQSLPETL